MRYHLLIFQEVVTVRGLFKYFRWNLYSARLELCEEFSRTIALSLGYAIAFVCKALKELKGILPLSQNSPEEVVYNLRGVLLMGFILRDSEVARQVRDFEGDPNN